MKKKKMSTSSAGLDKKKPKEVSAEQESGTRKKRTSAVESIAPHTK